MKKKVAITFPKVPFRSGGAELHVEVLKKKLVERGYDAQIISMPYKWYPMETIWENMLMWRMLDLSETDGDTIDYVIGTKFPSYFTKHEKKIMWLIHQERTAYDLIDIDWGLFKEGSPDLERFRKADTNAINESQKIFTISRNVSKRLKHFNKIDSECLYHPPKFVGEYYSDAYGDYILSVGRLVTIKRLDLLINAMKYTDKNIKCLIAGTGNAYQQLEEHIQKSGLEDRVKLLGYIDDKQMLKLYSQALAVYFAPVDEDYGYITLEAFFSKRPVISTHDAGGVLEFLEDGVSGFVSNVDPKEIAKSINKLYDNKDLCKDFGEAGFNRVKDISWDNALDRITDELKKI